MSQLWKMIMIKLCVSLESTLRSGNEIQGAWLIILLFTALPKRTVCSWPHLSTEFNWDSTHCRLLEVDREYRQEDSRDKVPRAAVSKGETALLQSLNVIKCWSGGTQGPAPGHLNVNLCWGIARTSTLKKESVGGYNLTRLALVSQTES